MTASQNIGAASAAPAAHLRRLCISQKVLNQYVISPSIISQKVFSQNDVSPNVKSHMVFS